MQHTENTAIPRSRGGRTSSPKLRESIKQSQKFEGLEENVKHFELLTLVKKAGKQAGFTSKMIEVLEHYMVFTRPIDWLKGNQPIVYKSKYQTAMDLNLCERHLGRLENELFKIGALTWNDSGNCKRYGQRDPESGKIIFAYGVDLSPLAYKKAELENIVQEQKLFKDAWMETKRQVSWHRGQIQSIISELVEVSGQGQGAYQAQYEAIAVRYKTTMPLVEFRAMLSQHQDLYNSVLEALEAHYKASKISKESTKTDSDSLHKQDTNNNQFNKLNTCSSTSIGFQKSSKENSADKTEPSVQEDRYNTEKETHIILKTGLQHVSLKQMLNVCGDDLKNYLPIEPRPMNITDFVTAAYDYKSKLFISQGSWAKACHAIGREAATLCVILTDRAVSRDENPVRKPAAYFNAMISRAKCGDLHLHKAVFGLLKKEVADDAANSNLDSTQKRKG